MGVIQLILARQLFDHFAGKGQKGQKLPAKQNINFPAKWSNHAVVFVGCK
jgi:hypothetical protein